MRQLADLLRHDNRYEFKFCTAYISERSKKEKFTCLKKYFADLTKDEVIFVPYGESKFDYVKEVGEPGNVICIIDDYSDNLHDAEAHGVTGIKAMNGLNGTKGTWAGERISVYDHPVKNMMAIQRIMG